MGITSVFKAKKKKRSITGIKNYPSYLKTGNVPLLLPINQEFQQFFYYEYCLIAKKTFNKNQDQPGTSITEK